MLRADAGGLHKQMKETLKGLKAAKDGLEALNTDSWAIISAYSIIPD